MAIPIVMPKLGLTMVKGTVVKWCKAQGEHVAKGEPLVVIMTEKITYELPSPGDGLLHIIAQEKATRAVGEVIGYLLAPGEAPPAGAAPAPAVGAAEAPAPPAAAQAPGEFIAASPAAKRLAREKGVDLALVKGTGPGGRIVEQDVLRYLEAQAAKPRIVASPLAQAIAEKEGVDLSQVQGTGPGGRIEKEDVLRYLEARKAPPVVPPPAAPARRTIPFTGMRQIIAERMTESLRTMAQLTISTEADVTELVRARETLKKDFDLTYTDLIIKAVAKALRQHPNLNSSLVGEEIVLLDEVNIGLAVALEDGLIVPVIRNADRLSLQEIAAESKRLAEAARAGTLTVDQVTGGTFTITNLGIYEVDAFTPIVNPPECAILGIGRIIEKPVARGGEIAIRQMMHLSLSFDHRLVDGAPAAAFLRTVKRYLEDPYLLL